MPSSDNLPVPARRRSGQPAGRLLLAAVLGLAVLGAAALVFTDDERWLRLGIVAALWAALVGAFAAARYRREVVADRDRSEELRRVYELELEREVAARREYELEVETETRRRVEGEVRDEVRTELDGLRGELRTLRQNLEALLGGEVLVERVALRAESTRLRSLSDQSRAVRSALPAGSSRQGQTWDADLARAFNGTNGGNGSMHETVHDAEVVSSRAEPHRGRPDPAPAGQPRPRADQVRVDRPRPTVGPYRSPEPPEPTDILPRYQGPAEPPRFDGQRRPSEPAAPAAAAGPAQPARAAARPIQPPMADQVYADPAQATGPWRAQPEPPVNGNGRRRLPDDPQPDLGRRHRADEGRAAEQPRAAAEPARPAAEPGGRRRADENTGAWRLDQNTGARRADQNTGARRVDQRTGARRRVDDDTGARRHRVDEDTGARRRRVDEDTGSHATGRSVNELLASYGDEAEPRRRHRRDRG